MPQCSLRTLQQRAFLLSKIRDFFTKKNVLEVETPILSSYGNTDVHIDSFNAQPILRDYAKSYLRTSPEFALKRLLCAGYGDVYEMAKVFRRSEISTTHNVEFTMLEWYRINVDYFQFIQEVGGFFQSIFSSFDMEFSAIELIDFEECFKQYLGLDMRKCSLVELNQMCQSHHYAGSMLERDEALDFLFSTQIQPSFDKKALTFVTLYPASQSALAEINPDDNQTCLRFEVFYKGHELGNAYQELTNADELLERFNNDNAARQLHGAASVNIDQLLIAAMRSGMSACSGIAIGVDRLLMVLLDCQKITDVMPFTAHNS